ITGALEASVTTVDASDFTGKLASTLTNAAVDTVTGGAGDETFDLTGTYFGGGSGGTRDATDGGDGRDTLVLTADQGVVAANQANVTNVEVIFFYEQMAAYEIDLTRFASADTLKLADLTKSAAALTFNSGSTIEFITGDNKGSHS